MFARCWLAVVLCSVAGAGTGAVEQVRQQGGVQFRALIDKQEIELSSFIVLTLSIDGPSPLEIEPIESVTSSPDWLATPQGNPQVVIEGGRHRWQQSFRLEPWRDREVPLPLDPVEVRIAGKQTITARWEPFTVKVHTVVAGTALGAMKPETSLEWPPEPARRSWLGWLTGLAAVLGLAVAGVFARKIRRKEQPQPVELAPDAWARRELDRLAALNLPASGQFERYHTQLADILRCYIERRFGVNTGERTTTEWLADLERSSLATPLIHQRCQAIFELCDLAKFARVENSLEDCEAVLTQSRDLVSLATQVKEDQAQACPGDLGSAS